MDKSLGIVKFKIKRIVSWLGHVHLLTYFTKIHHIASRLTLMYKHSLHDSYHSHSSFVYKYVSVRFAIGIQFYYLTAILQPSCKVVQFYMQPSQGYVHLAYRLGSSG